MPKKKETEGKSAPFSSSKKKRDRPSAQAKGDRSDDPWGGEGNSEGENLASLYHRRRGSMQDHRNKREQLCLLKTKETKSNGRGEHRCRRGPIAPSS